MRVIMDELDNIFMSYEKILRKLKLIGIKTKGGKEISHKDLRYAVSIMLKNILLVDGEVRRLSQGDILFYMKHIYG